MGDVGFAYETHDYLETLALLRATRDESLGLTYKGCVRAESIHRGFFRFEGPEESIRRALAGLAGSALQEFDSDQRLLKQQLRATWELQRKSRR